MTQEAVTLEQICSACGTPGTAQHIQHCLAGKLAYSISFRCARCNCATEADGAEPAADVRRALVDAGGTWALTWTPDATRSLVVARFLVEERGLGRAAAVALAKSTSEPLAAGTHTEMVCARDRLAALGVATVVRRRPS